MAFDLQFAPVLSQSPALIQAFWLTIKISFAAIFFGSLLGLMVATARSMLGKRVRVAADLYVETIRNTPFLVQLYIVFFGLPVLGVLIPADVAGLLALTINLSAYSAEIFRAGVESVHRSQIEAGLSLSLTRWQVFVHVMLRPAVANVWPSLVSQFILTMLASSICSFISVQELSGEAVVIQSQTFRSFEVYIVASVMYLALALVLKLILTGLGHLLFAQRTPRRRSSVRHSTGTGVSS